MALKTKPSAANRWGLNNALLGKYGLQSTNLGLKFNPNATWQQYQDFSSFRPGLAKRHVVGGLPTNPGGVPINTNPYGSGDGGSSITPPPNGSGGGTTLPPTTGGGGGTLNPVLPPTMSPPTPTTPIDTLPSNPNSGDMNGYNPTDPAWTGYRMPPLQSLGPDSQLGNFQSLYNMATGGTINSYNTAANRLRERLDSSARGQQQQMTQSLLGRGAGNSGLMNRNMNQLASANQNAYAQGLNELSNQFETQRQQGLQTGLGAAGAASNTLNNADQNLFGLLNNREDRDWKKYLQDSAQGWQSGENDKNRQAGFVSQQNDWLYKLAQIFGTGNRGGL